MGIHHNPNLMSMTRRADHDDRTLMKVRDTLVEGGFSDNLAIEVIRLLNNAGILFREFVVEDPNATPIQRLYRRIDAFQANFATLKNEGDELMHEFESEVRALAPVFHAIERALVETTTEVNSVPEQPKDH